jgi:uncharacterized membrane protein YagU involved in acid resistance
MKIFSWLLAGFVGTVLLTALLAISQGLRLTRINIPYLVGTMVTPNRDRARVWGIALHLLNGWIFALFYVAVFQLWHAAAWWLGAMLGGLHAVFVLAVAMPALPALHPRMANEERGPTPTRQLEPPGFLAMHYGSRTPLSILAAHILYGAVLAILYRGVA